MRTRPIALAVLALTAAVGLAGCLGTPSAGDGEDADTPFYEGMTITLIAPSSAGGSSDTFVRTLARGLEEHLEGDPNVIVENMDGGGGVLAHNYLAGVDGSDGLTLLGSTSLSAILSQLSGESGIEYDYPEFVNFGAIHDEQVMTYLAGATGFTSIEELAASGSTVRMGTQDLIHPGVVASRAIELAMDATLFEFVAGYAGGSEVDLDIERGAIDGRTTGVNFATEYADWIESGFVTPVFYSGDEPNPDFPDVPIVNDIAVSDERATQAQSILDAVTLPRRILGPAGMPEDAVAAIEAAVEAMSEDAAFMDELAALGFVPAPYIPGSELQARVDALFADAEVTELLVGMTEE